jgi:hypothetical protein
MLPTIVKISKLTEAIVKYVDVKIEGCVEFYV